MDDIQTKMETLDNAQTVTIDVPNETSIFQETPTLHQGLEAVPVPVKETERRKGYDVSFKICKTCGTDAVDTTEKITRVCNFCKSTGFKEVDYMSGSQTGKIINQGLGYLCHSCGKLYSVPTKCCLAALTTEDKKKNAKEAWYCTSCQTVYYRKPHITCCTDGYILQGKAYKATYKEFLATPKILKPIH